MDHRPLPPIFGGAIVVSGVLFFIVPARGQTALRTEPAAYRFSVAVHPPRSLPAALNGFALWLVISASVARSFAPSASKQRRSPLRRAS